MTQKVELYAENYTVREQDDDTDGFIIEGLALPFGAKSRNGVVYNKESCISNRESMLGCPVLFNHDESMLPLGHVQQFKPGKVNGQEGMVYEINIDPEESDVVRKLQRGDVSKVSIQAYVDEAQTEGDEVWVEDFAELSIVTIPGFKQTNVAVASSAEVETAVSVDTWMEQHRQHKKEALDDDEDLARKGEPFAGFDDFNDCVSKNTDKENPEAYCAAIKRQVGETTALFENNSMETMKQENFESVSEQDLYGMLAGMYEGASADDIAEALDQFDYDPDARQIAEFVADAYGVTPDEVLEALANLGGETEMKDDQGNTEETEGSKEQSNGVEERVGRMEELMQRAMTRLENLEDMVQAMVEATDVDLDQDDEEEVMDDEDEEEEEEKAENSEAETAPESEEESQEEGEEERDEESDDDLEPDQVEPSKQKAPSDGMMSGRDYRFELSQAIKATKK